MKKKLIGDSETRLFSAAEEVGFAEFLSETSKTDSWMSVALNKTEPRALEFGPLLIGAVLAEGNFAEGVSSEAIIDTGNAHATDNSKFAIRVDGVDYPLSKTAATAYVMRLGADAPRFNKLSSTDKQTVLQCYTGIAANSAKILFRDEKIRAVNGENYVVMPQDKLFEAITTMLNEKYVNWSFEGGSYCHDFTMANFTMPDQADDILGDYSESLKDILGKDTDMIPAITFSTSDTGLACASVSVRLQNANDGRRVINIGSPLRMEHKSGASVEEFSAKLSGIFAQFCDRVQALKSLSKITVDNPKETAENIAKKCGVSKVALRDAIETFSLSSKQTTADEVFFVLQEALFNMRCNAKFSRYTVFQCEENIARCLSKGFDWNRQ